MSREIEVTIKATFNFNGWDEDQPQILEAISEQIDCIGWREFMKTELSYKTAKFREGDISMKLKELEG